jgi:hypothetical protein
MFIHTLAQGRKNCIGKTPYENLIVIFCNYSAKKHELAKFLVSYLKTAVCGYKSRDM